MGKTSNASKQRWAAEHYAQVKVSVAPEVARRFKERCALEGVSMAGEIARFMDERCEKPASSAQAPKVATRQQRRKALDNVAAQLRLIMDAESQYMENIPENLRGSARFDAADQAVCALQDALDALDEAYT